MDKRLYHILTPMPPEELRTVNCLLVGAVSIPQCIFKSQVSSPRDSLTGSLLVQVWSEELKLG
jgi:hypothetical protein